METMITLRRQYVSAPLRRWFRRVLPAVSVTEREALEAGTVWWDGELFSGKPDWSRLFSYPAAQLSDEEQAFIDGPVDELCGQLNDWEIHSQKDLPPAIWQFLRNQGFFGLIIPKEFGGKGFSALGHSSAVMKIATRSLSAAVTVMVPNSLGPAELLLHYGTEEQKNYYLPRLASGEELPCFALTGPWAGSDAAAMRDEGVVCYQDVDGKTTLGIRLNFDKRYITLAPVATVMGLAFKLHDPDALLGDTADLGITLALIPTATPGIEVGDRHLPSNQAFQNGPIRGKDVFIPLERIIGGRDGIGRGWLMLMNCLAAGRAISLPSTGTAGAKFCARTTGAYARVRTQFRTPIGRFEGVQEALGRIAGEAYILDAARQVTATAVDHGEKPSVLSAIVKYHFTERMRQVMNDAMDVHGGKAICEGPSNYLATGYQGLPIVITVEGANILTRSMMIFGQGAIRCHPFLRQEMEAAQRDDDNALADFDQALFGHLAFSIGNGLRGLLQNLSGGRWMHRPMAGPVGDYARQLGRMSSNFALVADLTMLLLGGELKRRERLSARLGDVLSELYLSSCVLKRFVDDGQPAEDLALLHWSLRSGLHRAEQRLAEILSNFPSRLIAGVLNWVVFPWGCRHPAPDDRLHAQVAELLLSPSATRERLTAGVYVSRDPEDITGCLEHALAQVLEVAPVERKLRAAGVELTPSGVRQAVSRQLITDLEARQWLDAEAAVLRVIEVDDFAPGTLGVQATGKLPEAVLQSG